MIRFNANLYRIAMLSSSKEEASYYLQGAFVEPHAVKGVTMIATDGHKLVAVYDEDGFADESAIVKLTSDALKACKSKNERRDVVIATGSSDAVVNISSTEQDRDPNTNALIPNSFTTTDTPVAFSKACKIEGTFPDYRRVLPQPVNFTADSAAPSFAAPVLDLLCTVATELAAHYGSSRDAFKGALRVNGCETDAPVLVTFPPGHNAFAVAMPMRTKCEAVAPDWFNAAAPAPAEQETEAA